MGTQNLVQGGNLISASVAELQNGMYFLQVSGGQAAATYRFVVNK